MKYILVLVFVLFFSLSSFAATTDETLIVDDQYRVPIGKPGGIYYNAKLSTIFSQLGIAPLPAEVTQVEAEAGTSTTYFLWSPERIKQAIDALASVGSTLPSQSGQSGKFLTTNGSTTSWGTPTDNAGYQGVASSSSTSMTSRYTYVNTGSNIYTLPTSTITSYTGVFGNDTSLIYLRPASGTESIIRRDGTVLSPGYGLVSNAVRGVYIELWGLGGGVWWVKDELGSWTPYDAYP